MTRRKGLPWRRWGVVVLLAGWALAMPESAVFPQSSAPQTRDVQKRALLVAVGTYAPGTGWERLASATDLKVVGAALEHHGFQASEIRKLSGSEATREAILEAIGSHLHRPAGPGDILVLLLSGHGQQLTDGPDADELDGYDEAFVPWDAPRSPAPGYRGEKHLRDDDLGRVVRDLRRRVGPDGDVLVLLDSCHSGTGLRGDGVGRGGPPLGPPRQRSDLAPETRGSGFREAVLRPADDPETGPGTPLAAPSRLAPITFLAASRSDQQAYEMRTVEGDEVGPLSLAFARGLLDTGLEATYRGLAEEIRWQMVRAGLPQEPQAEGDLDRSLFGGRFEPIRPFLEITGRLADSQYWTVRPGSLAGLRRGAELEVHARGTTAPSPETLVAHGKVVESHPTEAVIQLVSRPEAAPLSTYRVFVTKYAFGDAKLRVHLEPSWGHGKAGIDLAAALDGVALVDRARDHAEVLVALEPSHLPSSPRVWTLRDRWTGETLARGPYDPIVGGRHLATRLESLARNRYLRQVRISNSLLGGGLEIVPVEVGQCVEPARPRWDECQIELRDRQGTNPSLGVELVVGDFFQLRLLPSRQAAYPTVLALMPDGQIEVLWPPRGHVEEMAAGKDRLLPRLFEVIEPTGTDQLLLILSREFLDFRPFRWVERVSPDRMDRGPRDTPAPRLGPFEPLFDASGTTTRSHRVSLDNRQIHVESTFLRVRRETASERW